MVCSALELRRSSCESLSRWSPVLPHPGSGYKVYFFNYCTAQIWMKEVCHIFENFEILVFFNSGKQVLFLRKVLAKNYKGKFFSREACVIKFPLWKQYYN